MYLSLLHVNTKNEAGRRWIGNVYRVHQRLWMGFPDRCQREQDPFFLGTWQVPAPAQDMSQRNEGGFLFRIEFDGPMRILVQSVQEPDWHYAFQNAPWLLNRSAVRSCDPAPRVGEDYRFRLLANVVDRTPELYSDGRIRKNASGRFFKKKKRKEVVIRLAELPEPLPVDQAQRQCLIEQRWEPWRQWITATAVKHGFKILDQPPVSMQTRHVVVRKPNVEKPRPLNPGMFEGCLRCTDAALLRSAMIQGIGPAKAFGLGLLSIAPAQAGPAARD